VGYFTCALMVIAKGRKRHGNIDNQKRIKELEVENKVLRRPLEAANFKVDGMLAIGNELNRQDKRIKELEAENENLKEQIGDLRAAAVLKVLMRGGNFTGKL